jgi:YHS domain-containing protein
MKHFFLLSLMLFGLMKSVSAQSLQNLDKSGLAIKGYDPVAYFTENAAVKGDPQFTATFEGATYRFASKENQSRFESSPAKYAPQFGGFCAWAVSQGYTASIDPKAFQIVDGRLLLQYSTGVREDFSKDALGNLKKADANWPGIVAKKGR